MKHGTAYSYKRLGCRCASCCAYKARENRKYRRTKMEASPHAPPAPPRRERVCGSLDPVPRVPLAGPLWSESGYVPSPQSRSPFTRADAEKTRRMFADSIIRRWKSNLRCAGCRTMPKAEDILAVAHHINARDQMAGRGVFTCSACRSAKAARPA